MKIMRFLNEVITASCYRTHPINTFRLAYAKWLFSRRRISDPLEFFDLIGINKSGALEGFQKWRPKLQEVFSKVRQAQGHQGGVSFEDGMILYGLTRALKPEFIVETGVAAGVSTSFISAALLENKHGMLYSIELPPKESAARIHLDGATFDWPKDGVGWAIPQEIRKAIGSRHVLILQDVRVALPDLLNRLPYVDIFFHDDLHAPEHMLWEYELVWPRLRAEGVLISDDVNFGWIQFCRKHGMDAKSLCNIQRLSAVQKILRNQSKI
jgi:hypothetical protein